MSRTGRQKRVCPRIWETPGEAVPFKTFPVLGSRSGGGSPGFGAIATATTAGFKRAHANKTELAPLRNAAAAAGHVTVGSEQALRSLVLETNDPMCGVVFPALVFARLGPAIAA
jgi:hypothetical protein